MSDLLDDGEEGEPSDPEFPVRRGCAEALFGEFSVLSPGVQIVLGGRPVSAPAD